MPAKTKTLPTLSEAVTALLAALDLDPDTTLELQINPRRGRLRIIGADRSVRSRSFEVAE